MLQRVVRASPPTVCGVYTSRRPRLDEVVSPTSGSAVRLVHAEAVK